MMIAMSNYAHTKRRGLSLVEVIIASGVLVLSAASIMMAFTASAFVTNETFIYQHATMLASNMMEEVARWPNYENGDYDDDSISGGVETDDACFGACNRACYDDKTDFSGYQDGLAFCDPADAFVDTRGSAILVDEVLPAMYREVTVSLNDLGDGSLPAEEQFLEVQVVIYKGDPPGLELVNLVQLFGPWN